MARITTAALVLLLWVAAVAATGAQSLGEVAKREEARRRAIAAPSRVYTNDMLRPAAPPPGSESTPGAAVPSSGAATPAAPPATSPEPAAPPSPALAQAQAPASAAGVASSDAPRPGAPDTARPPARTEAEWRQRMAAARDGVSRAKVLREALQSRVNALATDFANRDDPAQRGVLASDRQRALAELDRTTREIQQQQQAVSDIQEEARRAGVPPGWLR